jgi:opacity protein-like surface antigen
MMNSGRSVTQSGICALLVGCVLWAAPGASVAQGLSVDERLERLEQKTLSQPPGAEQETGNMVFFRGGWAGLVNDRSNEVFTDVFGFSSSNDQNTGYYVGAGLDLVLSKNLWGMLSNTWALGEIGVEFKRFDSEKVTQAVPSTCGAAIPSSGCTVETNKKVQITMLTVNVAPKIMFMEGSRFRPWIIPVGLDFHVISPPSNDTTVLDIGVQFAVGAQYRIWKAIHLGVDGRFHLATGQTDTTNNFGTAGGFVGIAF